MYIQILDWLSNHWICAVITYSTNMVEKIVVDHFFAEKKNSHHLFTNNFWFVFNETIINHCFLSTAGF